MSAAPVCPSCGGDVWVHQLQGLLSRHAPSCLIGRGEDVASIADHDARDGRSMFVRSVTRSEAVLLVAAGADESLVRRSTCSVIFLSPSVRARRFSLVIVSALPNMPNVDPALVS